ncbi:MAG: 2Fe-2S iron-sulfur cluster-binding protein [Rhodocyclaceae bacterium]|nr:2Fe-2S iron-sulfur cluster-binding protein [Rhodocyclaceae bacterium]
MAQMLSISRAAHLIGVTRGALQKRIREGELASFDGTVTTEELLRLYPDLDLEESGGFEHVTQIKEKAFAKRVRERMLPSQEVLAQRLFFQSEELADLRRHLSHYHNLVLALSERLAAMSLAHPSEPLRELATTLDAGLARVLGSDDKTDTLAVMDDVMRVMSARITVKPSGGEFVLQGPETVLEAALRSGHAPSYGCGNGNCGLCKARVVSGELRQVRPFDYPLSSAEKAQNYALLCCNTAVTDLVVEMIEAESPGDIPEQHIAAKVKSVTAAGTDTLVLHVQTPRSSRLRFMAGQSVSLGVAGGTADFQGDYAIASCSCDDRNLLFHVPREEGNEFAVRLFAGAIRGGDSISVWGPWGDFVLKKDSTRATLFLACDTGFAPVKSLIEHALAVEAAESIALYWTATRADGHYLENHCRAWADVLDDFSYHPLTAPDESAAGTEAARTAISDLADVAERDVYIAGPEAFVQSARAALLATGLLDSQLIVVTL